MPSWASGITASLADIFFGHLANLMRRRRDARRIPRNRLQFQTLENRLLLSADPLASIFTFDAPDDAAADDYTLRLNADSGHLELLDDTTVIASQALEATSQVVINGEDFQDDYLTVDFAFGGFFSLAGGIVYNGGADADDGMSIEGGTFVSATHTFTDTGPGLCGDIVYDDGVSALTIAYTDLEPLDMSGSTLTTLVFNMPGTDDQAILEDDGTTGNNATRIRSLNGTFETTTFGNGITSLTLNMGAGNDTLTVSTPVDFNKALTVNGQSGTDNVVFTGTMTFISLTATVSGSVTDTAGTTLNVGNSTRFTAGSVVLGENAGDVTNFGSLNVTATIGATITEDSDTVLFGTNTAGALILTSAGTITDTTGTSLSVSGGAALSGISITLGENAADTTHFGSLSFNSSGVVSITEDSAMTLTSGNGAINVALTAGGALTIEGNLTAGTGDIRLDSNGGAVTQTAGVLSGNDLSVEAVTGVDLGNVTIDTLQALNITGTVTLTDMTGGLSIVGAGVTNGGEVTIGTPGTLTLTSNVTATGSSATLNIHTAAQAGGTINATTALLTSVGGVTLAGLNVSNISAINADGGAVSLGFSGSTTIVAAIQSDGGSIGITSGGNLSVGGNVLGDSVSLEAAAAIGQTGGIVTAGRLSARAESGINLFSVSIGDLDAQNTTSGDISIGAAGALNVLTDITNLAASGDVRLAASGALTLTGDVTVQAGRTVFLDGEVIADAGGTVNATTLNLTSENGATLTDLAITRLSAVNTGAGNLDLSVLGAVTIVGPGLTNSNGNIAVGTTGTLTVASTLDSGAGAISLDAPSGVVFMPSGVLQVDIGGASEFTHVFISDAVTLNGTLNVNLVNGFLPTGGSRFQFIAADSRNGSFGTTNLPADFVVDQSDPLNLQLVFGADTTPPVITVFGESPLVIECHVDEFTDPGATAVDETAGDLTGAIVVSGSVDAHILGTYILTYSVSDGFNATEAQRIVNVVDTTAPALSAPADAVMELGSSTAPDATGFAVAADLCGPVTIAFSDVFIPAAGATGVIERSWLATDTSGNEATDIQTITVVDTTPPLLVVPADAVVELGGSTSPDTTGFAAAVDLSGPVTIAFSDVFIPAAGGTGTIARTWTATDDAGNAASAAQTIAIVDTTSPAVTIDQATGQADPADASPILFTVLFSEPVFDLNAEDISFAGSTVGGALTASVDGSGASYTVAVTGMDGTGTVMASIVAGAASDAVGNFSSASTSTDNMVLFDGNDAPVFAEIGAQTVVEGHELRFTVSASDNDPAASLIYSATGLPVGASFDAATREFVWVPADNGSATVTFTVLDPHGATDTMEVTLTATNVAPTVDAGTDQVVGLQMSTGTPQATVSIAATFSDPGTLDTHLATIDWGDGTASDGASGSHTYLQAGIFTVTVTVTDDDGGVSSDTLRVTVQQPNPLLKANNDKYDVTGGTLQVNAEQGVLSNDGGGLGSLLARLVEAPLHGTLTFNADGSFTYVADAGFKGKDVFWYEVSDGSSVSQLVKVDLKMKDSPQPHQASVDWGSSWRGNQSSGAGGRFDNLADFLLLIKPKRG